MVLLEGSRLDAAGRISDDLRRRIYSGDLPEGTPLREGELVLRYGGSRHTIRAALRDLRADALVEHDRHRSARVRTLTAGDVRDLYGLRRLLELEALPRMVELDAPVSRLEQVVDTIDELERLRQPADPPDVAEIDGDIDFHLAIVAGAGSPRLTRAFDALVPELRLAFVSLTTMPGEEGEHRAMLEAIQARDVGLAVERLEMHLRDGLRICLAAHI